MDLTTSKVKEIKNVPDEILVSRAKKGDSTAFEELIKRYEDKIYALAYRILGDKDEAYDVLQDSVINVFQHLREFKGKSSFFTWLYRIVVNSALMKKRKNKHYEISTTDKEQFEHYSDMSVSDHQTDWSSDPVLSMENKELKKVLNESLNKIPEKYKNAVILKDIDGRPLEEVAKILNISVPAVKSRLHRARMYLRWLLEKYVQQVYGTRYKYK